VKFRGSATLELFLRSRSSPKHALSIQVPVRLPGPVLWAGFATGKAQTCFKPAEGLGLLFMRVGRPVSFPGAHPFSCLSPGFSSSSAERAAGAMAGRQREEARFQSNGERFVRDCRHEDGELPWPWSGARPLNSDFQREGRFARGGQQGGRFVPRGRGCFHGGAMGDGRGRG
jgi:hypothetical protein